MKAFITFKHWRFNENFTILVTKKEAESSRAVILSYGWSSDFNYQSRKSKKHMEKKVLLNVRTILFPPPLIFLRDFSHKSFPVRLPMNLDNLHLRNTPMKIDYYFQNIVWQIKLAYSF